MSVTSDLRVPVAGTLTARPDSGAFGSSFRPTDISQLLYTNTQLLVHQSPY